MPGVFDSSKPRFGSIFSSRAVDLEPENTHLPAKGEIESTGIKTTWRRVSHLIYFGSASSSGVREEASSLFSRCSSRLTLLGCHLPP
jgi:hypothetical protein